MACLVRGPGPHAALAAVQLEVGHAAAQVGLVFSVADHVGPVAAVLALLRNLGLLFLLFCLFFAFLHLVRVRV